jgi:hypothetical protein
MPLPLHRFGVRSSVLDPAAGLSTWYGPNVRCMVQQVGALLQKEITCGVLCFCSFCCGAMLGCWDLATLLDWAGCCEGI